MNPQLKDLPPALKARVLAVLGQEEKAKAVPSHTPGKMNKWERSYADELNVRRLQDVRAWWFEAVKFRLAEGCWYCPDFLVQLQDGHFELHEVKGHWRDDAKVKAKVMAESFPFPLFIVKRGAGGSGWQAECMKARSV